ncbi:CAP domain-containing protein [Roseibium sp. HPY-6]|uniref:CAP domain-containing protein n=1 Tax=Roseibium sp. HPY-6 TaxID=3229852 RepID=UPI00338EA152
MVNNPVNKLSSSEQLILELVNKERLAAGLEPLASAAPINAAAQKHSEWMASGRVLDHTGAGGSSPWDRMKAEGWNEYPMGENIAYNPFNQHTPISGAYVPQAIVEGMHTGWMNSTGHRANILNSDYTVIGIGDAIGGHPSNAGHSTSYGTQNFAGTTKNYVTGVVFDDEDGSKFYDIGEELGATTVTIVNSSGATVATKATDPGGGYSIALANGSYTAKFTGSGINGTIEKSFSISGKNVKVDVKDGSEGGGTPPPVGGNGNDTVTYTNGDDFWDNGVPKDIGGAGIDTLVIAKGSVFNTSGLSWYGFERFQGADKNDRVVGNEAGVDYRLSGGGGNDTLQGNAGDDTLLGGPGNDRLYGKAGNDIIKGGTGRDVMFGGAGNDTIHYGSGDIFWDNGKPRDIGGSGVDTLVVEAGSKFVTSALSKYGFERFKGADKDDRVVGDDAKVAYVLNGGGGNDFLKGNAGNDTLLGGSGNDRLDPGASSGGLQKLSGQSGNDTYVISSNSGRVDIIELAGNGNDTLIFKDLKRSDVEVSLNAQDKMVLSWNDGAGQVTINDEGAHLDQFVFMHGATYQPDDFAFV